MTGPRVLLVDPTWRPAGPDDLPPLTVVLGVWDDSPFRPNPVYRPTHPGSPTDPVDALLTAGDGERLGDVFAACPRHVAVDEDGMPWLVASPDGMTCVVVATAWVNRGALAGARWVAVTLPELVGMLGDGEDLLVNPGAGTPARLSGDFVRTLLLDDL